MSIEVSRTNNTRIRVETTNGGGNRITVGHFMWMATELQKALDAGMPSNTEVKVFNDSGSSGVRLTADATLSQEIP